MSDELFPYYDSELAYLRQLGEEFAREHPAAAWALQLGENNSDAHRDPHVERLLQGVAFLNARIRHRLDDDFPELAESVLNTLYPHYLAPFPSCAIAELKMNAAQVGPDSSAGRVISKGSGVEFNQATAGAPLQYRTAYAVHLLPIRVASLTFRNDRFESPPGTRPREANAALHLQLETITPDISFDDLAQKAISPPGVYHVKTDSLTFRFFLHGQARTVHAIYNQLLRSTLRVVCCENINDGAATCLGANVVSSVGFHPNEELLPQDGRVLPGYRLVHEFFAFPQKFHFIDVSIPRSKLKGIGQRLQILFMTREENEDLPALISTDSLRLGCTPIVNLFDSRAEFARNYRQAERRLIVDMPFPLDYEIFSVKRVRVTSAGRQPQEYRSFYDIYHASGRETVGYWHIHRRQSGRNSSSESGTEVYLSLVDHAVHADVMDDATVSVDVVCMNRNHADRGRGTTSDSAAGNSTPLQLTAGDYSAHAELVTRPTPIQRRSGRSDWRWRLCSHLALNHLSLTDIADGTDGFREILRLYNVSESPTFTENIEGLVSVAARKDRVMRRVADGPHAFARGMEVTLRFREAAYPDGGMFLFASVIRSFLSNYCTINSFVETIVRSSERDREIHRWPAHSGTRPLV